MNSPQHNGSASAPQRALEEHERFHPDHHGHHADVGSAPPVKPASTSRMVAVGIGAAIVLAGLLVMAFIPRRDTSRQLAAEVATQDGPPTVQVASVTRAASGGDIVLPGTIQPLHEGAIYARVGGYVKAWQADIGRVVHTGDVLAEIDAPELEQEVQQAQAQLAQTHAALGLAKADLARWKSLAADSAVSREEYDQKSAAYDAAVANSNAADANVRRLGQMHAYTRVTAPFNGVITARNVDIGSLITPAGASSASVAGSGTGAQGGLFRIAQTDTVRTYISVPQSDALSMTTGLKADVTVQEFPNRTFTGRIVRTSQSIDAASRTLLTEVDIANPGFSLLSGMYSQVHLHLTHSSPSLIIPSTALVIRATGTQVITVDSSQPGQLASLHFVPVTIARDFGGTIEVQSGVTDGMTLVSNPSADLNEGMRVKIAQAPAKQTSAPAAAEKAAK
ncbi:MAG TPA: efflux RND transporter periplasmic adaptor subunit [Gemmatimonadaceae bacterium]|jgi:RND family efflux transporter MFP subunit